MTAEMPDVGFVTGKACAVDSGLLTCTDADSLTVNGIAYAV